MPLTLVNSKWASGSLVFHDAGDLGVGAEILRIAQDDIAIGTSTNDVTMTMYGDVTLYGDIDLGDEDISLAVGKYLYLDGQDGNDFLRASTDNNVILNGQTTVNLGVGGTTEVAVSSSAVTLATNNLTLTAGNLSVGGTAGITGTTTCAAINASGAVGITNTLTVGVSATGHDVKFWGDTAGTYMLWDYSADGLKINVEPLAAANLFAVQANCDMDAALGYYYGIQSNASKSGTDNTDDFTCITAYINQTTGAFTTTGRFCPLQVLLSGSGTVGTITKTGNGAVHAAWIANRGTQTNTDSILCVHNQSAATATSALELDIGGTVTYAIDFGGTVSDGWTSGNGAIAGSSGNYAKIPVKVDGVTGTLYLLAAAVWA